MADLHLQVKPRSDFYLATILARFVMMESGEDREWLEEFVANMMSIMILQGALELKAILDYIGLSLDDIGDFLLMLQNRKVVHFQFTLEFSKIIDLASAYSQAF